MAHPCLRPLGSMLCMRLPGNRRYAAEDAGLPLPGRRIEYSPRGGNKKTKTARIWAYVRDERPWSGKPPPCVWYQFTVDRKGEHPVKHLSGYQGWVHAPSHGLQANHCRAMDGYAGFNGAFGEGKASEVACIAHIRRKFVDVFTAQGSAIAEEAIRRIAQLYGVEKQGGAYPPRSVLLYVKKIPNPSSMIWKTGCTPSCLKYQANRHWLKLSEPS